MHSLGLTILSSFLLTLFSLLLLSAQEGTGWKELCVLHTRHRGRACLLLPTVLILKQSQVSACVRV